MNRLLVIYILILCSSMSFAQTVVFKDKETKKPLEGVTLTSEKPKTHSVSNALGQADVSTFVGSEKILIRHLGYRPIERSYAEIEAAKFEIYLEFTELDLDEVVVSGSRWIQTKNDVPSMVVIISPKEVSLQNPQTAADLLNLSGRVYVQKSQQGGGSPMIRGFATNRLIYTVDGIRMNTAIFRSGNIQNVINLDPFATENTEILMGPGSVIYGSDAIGGVMSFRTIEPQLSMNKEILVTGKAVARYSTANKEKTGHFDVSIGGKKWAMATSFSAWDFDHLRQGSNGPEDYIKNYYVQRQDSVDVVVNQENPLLQIPSAYSQNNFMQKIRFKPNNHWDIHYAFHYSETSPYGRYDRHNRIRNGTARYAEWNYGPQIWMMNNLSISHNNSTLLYDDLSIRLAQQNFEESRIDRTLNKDERTTQTENVLAYSANLDLVKRISVKNKISYGVEYVINDVKSEGFTTDISTGENFTGPSRYPNSQWASMGAYINDEHHVTEKVMLQAGIRYNLFRLNSDFSQNQNFYSFPFTEATINNGSLTGSLGTVIRLDQKFAIRASLGTAFRAPNVDDIGKVFDSEPGSVTVPNPNLKAEYAYNADLGLTKIIGQRLKIDLSGYYTLLDNAMVRRNSQLNGQDSILYQGELSQVQSIQNSAQAIIYGLMGGFKLSLPEGFYLSGDFNYQLGEEELDDGSTSPSRHAAPFNGIGRFGFSNKKIDVVFYSMYQAEVKAENLPQEEKGKTEIYAKDENGNNYAPSWYTLNVKASCQLTETFRLSTGLENITDQRYRGYSSGISGAGRNFLISIQANF